MGVGLFFSKTKDFQFFENYNLCQPNDEMRFFISANRESILIIRKNERKKKKRAEENKPGSVEYQQRVYILMMTLKLKYLLEDKCVHPDDGGTVSASGGRHRQ